MVKVFRQPGVGYFLSSMWESQLSPRNLMRKMMPRKVSSTVMAIQTPCSPMCEASSAAGMMRRSQMHVRFMVQGMSVSRAPTKMP